MSYTQKTVLNIIAQLELQSSNDSRFSDQIDDIVDLLTENEEETIETLNSLEKQQLEWITSTFEELSFTFQSPKFIETIENLAKKFPEIPDIEEEVRTAKEVLE